MRSHYVKKLLVGYLNINLGGNRASARLTCLPVTLVAFVIVESTECEPTMVNVTAVLNIGKHHAGMRIVANPLLATLGLSQPVVFATQAASARIESMPRVLV